MTNSPEEDLEDHEKRILRLEGRLFGPPDRPEDSLITELKEIADTVSSIKKAITWVGGSVGALVLHAVYELVMK